MDAPFDLSVTDKLLNTTRSVRKRLDLTRPVSDELILDLIAISQQAPTGSNQQGWHWMIVTDAAKKKQIADIYAAAFNAYSSSRDRSGDKNPEQTARVVASADYLSSVMHEVPVLAIPCIKGRPENLPSVSMAGLYGSILPAVWNYMLAARSRGLGTVWTTLHLVGEREIADLLDIPAEFTQVALIPTAYYTGDDFKPAKRGPATEITSFNTW
ncbi:MAG: nitroreductase family protein [Antricoccus sp.]